MKAKCKMLINILMRLVALSGLPTSCWNTKDQHSQVPLQYYNMSDTVYTRFLSTLILQLNVWN